MAAPHLRLRHVVLLNVAAVFSLRTATDVARLGWAAIPLMIAAFLVFAIPLTLAVMSLSVRHPDEGGLYRWTQRAFGPGHGFLCGWCYFVTNLVYFPSVLAHVAAVLPWLLLGHPAAFAADPVYLVAVGLIGLWGVGVLPNVLGARRTGQLSAAGVAGALAATALLAVLAIVAFVRLGGAPATPPTGWLPSSPLGPLATFAMLSSLPFMFGGLELAPSMSGEIADPGRTLARGTLLAGALVTVLFFVAVGAILFALRPDEIGLGDGIPAAIAALDSRLGLDASGLPPRAIAAFLIAAACGALVVWMAGSAYLIRTAGVDRAMPAWFTRAHPRFGTPVGGLVAQGAVASLLLVASAIGSSVGEAYAVLRSVTQILYYIPFLYLFAAQIRLVAATRLRAIAALGFVTTAAGLLAALLPPAEVDSVARFELKVIGGSIALALAGLPLYRAGRGGRRTA